MATVVDPPWYETHELSSALVLAPPGCGKTESLARWVESLVDRGLVNSPKRILGLTFSNKAKANLRARLKAHLGTRWYRHALVTNFHGLAYRVYQHHAGAIGRVPLEIAPQRGWLKGFTNGIVKSTGCDSAELACVLRSAKCGPFDDEQVLARLEAAGLHAAMEYEAALRAQNRVDFDDVIRLGHLTLAHPGVQDLYQSSFTAVIVDEVQDLSLGQLELARRIGGGRSVYAGDLAQGIYGFAGAEPIAVLESIRVEVDAEYRLESSYRSSPAVLRAVSSVSRELGGATVLSAIPDEWSDRGTFRILRTRHVLAEAEVVSELVAGWVRAFPADSVAVIARTASRRRALDRAIDESGIAAEIWDFPAHRPLIAELLARHLELALLVGDPPLALQELYSRCLVDLDEQDLDALDELQEALEAIEELVGEGYSLADVVSGIRVSSDPDAPVGPGLHLLNGHLGKGQQFDRVVVLGLEEAILPHYAAMLAERSGDRSQITEELAVLHVMLSRAREDLVVTVADVVPKWNGQDMDRTPSRFLTLLTAEADEVLDRR
ncbi:UvrD-helicase domain-containing protein [Rhabdothermincola salaria]|uniref:UvrD-helicase domain-containing protein n=1 Tax=Rhabdothermincola salaria TaxID=2903142 RepID=UPI001E64059D|nr:ATP-dependent helicase [Rhabdothermincola salaria]MCD9625622.1 ATP-dependent helicase [Rhabdothermincola salaria]